MVKRVLTESQGASSQEGSTLLSASQSNSYGSTIMPSTSADDEEEEEGDTVYTELLSGSVPCPTCRGLGNVPKEQEGQLVALIPMKDKRLKPRRTYIWVCLAIFLSLTAAGLVAFFMFPRGVYISSNQPYLDPVGAVYVNSSAHIVKFMLSNRFNVSNNNFFPVKVNSVVMSVLYDTVVLSESTNKTNFEVPMRADRQYSIDINITFDKDNQMNYMVDSCMNPIRWAHEIVLLFEFTCNYSVLDKSEETTLRTFQFVSCYSEVKPSTVAPANTTVHSTTQSMGLANTTAHSLTHI